MQTNFSGSVQLYKRLLSYLRFMKQLPTNGPANISSTVLSDALGIHDVQVRKDLAMASDGGKPKIGYIINDLIADLESFLGHDNHTDAVLVGVGNLGKAFLSYDNFKNYGLKIVTAFDNDPKIIGTAVDEIKILDTSKVSDICKRLGIYIGIITVPAFVAQDVCNELVAGGIKAIWNFAPITLKAPSDVIIKNEDMAASLAMLLRELENNRG